MKIILAYLTHNTGTFGTFLIHTNWKNLLTETIWKAVLCCVSVCSNTLTDFSGVIESPNFPNPYPHSRNCSWLIDTTLGNTVNISFSHFEIESHSGCQFDYLQVKYFIACTWPYRKLQQMVHELLFFLNEGTLFSQHCVRLQIFQRES